MGCATARRWRRLPPHLRPASRPLQLEAPCRRHSPRTRTRLQASHWWEAAARRSGTASRHAPTPPPVTCAQCPEARFKAHMEEGVPGGVLLGATDYGARLEVRALCSGDP